MRWTYYSLSDDDPRAKTQVLRNLETGAYEHTLSRKLLQRFADVPGAGLLIALDLLDLDRINSFGSRPTYAGGQWPGPGSESISYMETANWGLVAFVDKHLLKTKDPVVLCENLYLTPRTFVRHPPLSRVLLFEDEVYHVLTRENGARPESVECAIGEWEQFWGTAVCSTCAEVPWGHIPSEEFFDAIVSNTKHIFVPALDGEGYLIWSPVVPKGTA